MRDATAYPAVQRDISMMILVGKQNAKAMEEAKRIHGIFEKFHPEPTGDDKNDKKTLFWMIKLDTKLQGTKLLDPEVQCSGVHRRFRQSSPGQERRSRGVDVERAKTPARMSRDATTRLQSKLSV